MTPKPDGLRALSADTPMDLIARATEATKQDLINTFLNHFFK